MLHLFDLCGSYSSIGLVISMWVPSLILRFVQEIETDGFPSLLVSLFSGTRAFPLESSVNSQAWLELVSDSGNGFQGRIFFYVGPTDLDRAAS